MGSFFKKKFRRVGEVDRRGSEAEVGRGGVERKGFE